MAQTIFPYLLYEDVASMLGHAVDRRGLLLGVEREGGPAGLEARPGRDRVARQEQPALRPRECQVAGRVAGHVEDL